MTDWGKVFEYSIMKLNSLCKYSSILLLILGSHGDGSTSETEVPIVTWGAGLSYAKRANAHTIPLPIDMKQADVAPLMATLIGVPIPVHSVVSNNFQ